MPAGDKLALAANPEIDIWRAASLMLKHYGEKALEESAARAISFSPSRITTAPPCGAGSSRNRPARQDEAVWPTH